MLRGQLATFIKRSYGVEFSTMDEFADAVAEIFAGGFGRDFESQQNDAMGFLAKYGKPEDPDVPF